MKSFLLNLFFILSIGICCSSCDSKDKSMPGPLVQTFSPSETNVGGKIVIFGSNFSTEMYGTLITIGTKDIAPDSISSTRIVFTVPISLGAGEYSLAVKTGSQTSVVPGKLIVRDTEIKDPDVLSFNYAVGTQTIGPSYGFTSNDRLVESAEAILSMGSNILKISLSPGSYNITGRPNYNSLVELVRDDPSFSKVLDMPFTYYFFWARSHANWADGYSASERLADSTQLADLTKYLLERYNNTGKQFFLGHWEGDWYLLPNYDAAYVPSDARLQGMIQWYTARQNAVDEAKRINEHSNVDVFAYCEVNRVVDGMNGLRRVVNYVLPYTNVDYVSYSSYDAQGFSQAEYDNVMNYIESKLPSRPHIKGKRVFIGEMGRSAMDFNFSKIQHEATNRENIRKALAWGSPFVLYWEMYNNEIKNNTQRGFWLIDDQNTKWPLYNSFSDFYLKSKIWVSNQRKTLNRLPTREEYLAWARAAF